MMSWDWDVSTEESVAGWVEGDLLLSVNPLFVRIDPTKPVPVLAGTSFESYARSIDAPVPLIFLGVVAGLSNVGWSYRAVFFDGAIHYMTYAAALGCRRLSCVTEP